MTLGLILHALAAMIWVGGMAFMNIALRPSLASLEPPARLQLFSQVLGRFIPWVWASIFLLLVSGYGMIFLGFGGFAAVGKHVHVMQGTGILMMLLFAHLYFAPWTRFRRALAAGDMAAAGKSAAQIRLFVAINLALGVITVAVGASGRYWG